MFRRQENRKRLIHNQDGLASIIIVAVILAIVALITIGFAGIVRREQRQALDQQLSAQAKYAAESAINEKIALFRSNPASLSTSSGCTNQGQTFTGSTTEIQTTCVQVDLSTGPQRYDQVRSDASTLVWLDPGLVTPLDRIVITWQNPASLPDNNCHTADYTSLPASIAGNQVGMLRFDLSRVGRPGETFTRASLRDRIFGGVLYPKQSGTATLPYDNGAGQQPRVFGTCGTAPAGVPEPYAAHAVIDLPNDTDFQQSRYILRLRSMYRSSMPVKVIGFDTGDNIVEFVDNQISLEATARVNDVVQRIQVQVPAGAPPTSLIPDDALHITNGICKLLETEPGSTNNNC